MKLKFNITYAIIALIIFIIEVLIALFLKGGFIRHTFGDYLVVVLIYCALKAIFHIKTLYAVIAVWIFAFAVEFLQLTNILHYFGLEHNTVAKIVFGTTFHVSDLIAYSLGCISIFIVEHYKTTNS